MDDIIKKQQAQNEAKLQEKLTRFMDQRDGTAPDVWQESLTQFMYEIDQSSIAAVTKSDLQMQCLGMMDIESFSMPSWLKDKIAMIDITALQNATDDIYRRITLLGTEQPYKSLFNSKFRDTIIKAYAVGYHHDETGSGTVRHHAELTAVTRFLSDKTAPAEAKQMVDAIVSTLANLSALHAAAMEIAEMSNNAKQDSLPQSMQDYRLALMLLQYDRSYNEYQENSMKLGDLNTKHHLQNTLALMLQVASNENKYQEPSQQTIERKSQILNKIHKFITISERYLAIHSSADMSDIVSNFKKLNGLARELDKSIALMEHKVVTQVEIPQAKIQQKEDGRTATSQRRPHQQ
jgi:hypothetical protein